MSDVGTKPVGVWIVAGALLWSSLSGVFLLVQELFSDSLFPPLPVLGDGATAVIAHWCVGLMCSAFLIAAIALLLSRRVAIPFFIAGLIFYAGYIASAFLIVLIGGAWHSVGGTGGGGLLLSALVTAASGFALLVAWEAEIVGE